MLVTNDRHYLFYRYQESLVSPLINPDYIIILEYKLFSQKYRKYHYTLIRLVRNINCWPRYGETATLIHFWWECKMVQPLGKLVVSTKRLPLCIYTQEKCMPISNKRLYKNVQSRMLILLYPKTRNNSTEKMAKQTLA